jgi:hypothetical protein
MFSFICEILNSYFKVPKIPKQNLDVANNAYYKCAKSQYELLCILGYDKITNFIVKGAHFSTI